MSVPVGLTIPKLLPITGTFALPFSAYYIYLQNRVVYHRLSTETYMGDNAGKGTNDPVYVATRAQKNYAENIPLALLIAAFVELNGGSRRALAYTLSTLFITRVLHAEFGLFRPNSMAFGRPIGYYGCQGVMLGLASYAFYLVKGYWDL